MQIVVSIVFVLLMVPVVFLGIEVAGAFLYQRKRTTETCSERRDLFAYNVLIPAHNEEKDIGKTIHGLLDHVEEPAQIVVVADNCSDKTAEIAAGYGVTVIERVHQHLRGKGYALDFGIQYLKQHSPPDVLVVFDADCVLSEGHLKTLVRNAYEYSLPTQAKNLCVPQNNAAVTTKISAFAMLLKNYIRPLGLKYFGYPCLLLGTGMAFPWSVVERLNFATGNMVEDMQSGIDCTKMGVPPLYCEEVTVLSYFSKEKSALKSQRTRWEHGHLNTLLNQVPSLFAMAIKERNVNLFFLALEVGVPPLSFLVLLQLLVLLIAVVYGIAVNSLLWMVLSFLPLVVLGVFLGGGWLKFGRDVLSWGDILRIPWYILMKVPIYLKLLYKPEKKWVRTPRE